MGSKHLILPDPHAHPDYNNDRFEWAGKLVADERPDHVICMGDWPDMPSLSSYDRGTRGFEGRRYSRDRDASIDALERFHRPIRARKRKLPKFWMLKGNHDQRVDRAVDANPYELEGIVSTNDFQFKEYGWEYIDYDGSTPGIVIVDGVAYAHYFTTGVAGRANSGLHPAYSLLQKQYQSCTQGHTHTTDMCVRTNAAGNHIFGLVVGCYIDYFAEWAGEANRLWWRGVVVCHNVENGVYEPEFISLDSIRDEYS